METVEYMQMHDVAIAEYEKASPLPFSATALRRAVDAAIAWNTRATPEPVAPTSPAPDIAGLVERIELTPEQAEACVYLAHRVLGKDNFAPDHARVLLALLADFERGHKEAATALQRVAQERDAAIADRNMHWRHWQVWKERAEAAEARLSSARDEGLEMAAKVVSENSIQHGGGAWSRLTLRSDGDVSGLAYAAAIRALKGTNP